MIVNVTQQHIDQGVKADCSQCVLALAMREMGFVRVAVTYDRVYATTRRIRDVAYTLSDEALSLVMAFDQNEPLTPSSVELIEVTEGNHDWIR